MYSNFQYGRIIIEPHTYCNRSCNFCLVNYMNKKYKNNIYYMSNEILEKTLNFIYNNISNFKIDKLTFSLFKYNEPLYDIDNLIYISKKIRQYFQEKNIETYLYIHTNGDYLNKNNFEKIMEFIDEIRINDYEEKGIVGMLNKIGNISKDIKFIKIIKSKNNLGKKNKILFSYKHKSVIAYYNSVSSMLKTSRGSVIQKYVDINSGKWYNDCRKRDKDCDVFNKILVIDYNGDIFPCCECSSRIKEHDNMKICNILDINTVDDILRNSKNINKNNSCEYCQMDSNICSYIDDNTIY